MKTTNFLSFRNVAFLVTLVFGIFTTSCSKDDDGGEPNPEVTVESIIDDLLDPNGNQGPIDDAPVNVIIEVANSPEFQQIVADGKVKISVVAISGNSQAGFGDGFKTVTSVSQTGNRLEIGYINQGPKTLYVAQEKISDFYTPAELNLNSIVKGNGYFSLPATGDPELGLPLSLAQSGSEFEVKFIISQ